MFSVSTATSNAMRYLWFLKTNPKLSPLVSFEMVDRFCCCKQCEHGPFIVPSDRSWKPKPIAPRQADKGTQPRNTYTGDSFSIPPCHTSEEFWFRQLPSSASKSGSMEECPIAPSQELPKSTNSPKPAPRRTRSPSTHMEWKCRRPACYFCISGHAFGHPVLRPKKERS